jgi:methionyl-tRNA formyltransferase
MNGIESKKKNHNIVYLGTENNMKSCLGLEEILKDGWNVKLVIGFIPEASIQNRSIFKQLLKKIFRGILYIFRLVVNLVRRRKMNIHFRSLRNLLSSYDFQLVLTSDRSLKSVYKIIQAQDCDILLSNGWQFKITPDVFSIARIEALNCHSAYLPEYRGGNITYAPLINEEKESGVTVHTIVDKFDAGMILSQERVYLQKGETPTSINTKRAMVTGKALITALSIAGEREKYKPNPLSPFYFRCSYNTYLKYKAINFFRKLLGMKIKKYEPRVRNDI